jgi:hypothetical protein
MIGCQRWQSAWSPAGTACSSDREGTARDKDGSGSGLANFLRMPCRLEGTVSVLGLGLATISLNGRGDGNPWVI